MSVADPAVAWLLDHGDPAVRALVCRELLARPTSDAATFSPLVRTLLTDPARTHPYGKWSGAHWRLVPLVELEVPTGQPIRPTVVLPHHPPYWHCDVLQAHLVLCRAGFADDPRAVPARKILASRRRTDGRWRAVRPLVACTWCTGSGVEAVERADVAHQMVSLNALRVGASEPG